MLRLRINAKRTEAAIVRRPQLILLDPATRLLQIPRHLLRALHGRVERIHHADESDLLDALGVAADGPPDLPVDARLVPLGRELDEEVAGVHGEEGGQQVAVGDLVGVDRVAVAAGAGVDADVGALGSGEAGQDAVVEVDEGLEQGGAGPRVAGVVLGCQAALCIIPSTGVTFSESKRPEQGQLPSVKSIETLFAPASKQPRMSFSHSFTKSSTNFSFGYPSTVPFNGYSRYSILGAITACFIP